MVLADAGDQSGRVQPGDNGRLGRDHEGDAGLAELVDQRLGAAMPGASIVHALGVEDEPARLGAGAGDRLLDPR
jgi:hypothetical protein